MVGGVVTTTETARPLAPLSNNSNSRVDVTSIQSTPALTTQGGRATRCLERCGPESEIMFLISLSRFLFVKILVHSATGMIQIS
ncbi:hypothetical protein RRG08_010856 [Elysia crispata]|uniref:Uncharacterized protein n=1 Tax=Elysia crispata TaxID=231223 RepID=A0AAE1CLZ8_9GAST|nr:hypothetical protein RRG08_010856 [Elysia crispata]